MAAVVADRARTEEALVAVTAQLAAMVRPLPDTAVPVPGWEWTVGEAVSHLVTSGRLFREWASGASPFYAEGTKEALAQANAHKLREFAERDGAALAEHLEETTGAFLAALAGSSRTTTAPTPMGPMDVDTLLSYLLTHTLIHGYPVAKALGQTLVIRKDYVPLTLPFLTTAMFTVLDPQRVRGLDASFLIHLRGGPRLAVSFTRGALSVGTAPTRRVDCHIVAEPVAFFLVAMGLVSQWSAIGRGKMIAWGTRPWLAFRFNNYFVRP
jgi:uncharacterized protein (TIGR03083 family)